MMENNEIMKVGENGMKVRDIEVITAEIKDLCRQAQTMALMYVVEIGRRLVEAKQALPYGEWGNWLKNEAGFSQSTATNYMRLFEEYGSSQISIFGASVDSQTFANLPYSKALQLLAVPQEEREEFAKEVGAEDLSVSELKKVIAERDRAQREAKEAQERENALAESLAEAQAATAEAQEKASEADALRSELEAKQAEIAAAQEKADKFRAALKEAKENPSIPKAELEKIRNEAEEAAKAKILAESDKELAAAKKKAEEAVLAAEKAKRAEDAALKRLAETEKRLKTASPEVTAFKALFDTVQETVEKLRGMVKKIRESDPEIADKLTNALKALGASFANGEF